MLVKIIRIVDKIIAIVFLLLFTLTAMVWMDKPEWLNILTSWFVLTYLMIKYVLFEKGLTRNEAKSIFQQVIYIFDRVLLFGQLVLWSIATFGTKGEEFTYLFIFWLLEVYLFGKYILLKKPKNYTTQVK